MVKRIIIKANHFFAEMSGWLLSAIMFLLIIDFVSRGLYRPIQGVGELAVFVLVAVVYLGIPHTEEVRGHVRVTAITSRFPPGIRKWVDVFMYTLALITSGFILYAVTLNALKAFLSQEAVAGTVPLLVWPVKFVIVIGCVFYAIQVFMNLLQEIKK